MRHGSPVGVTHRRGVTPQVETFLHLLLDASNRAQAFTRSAKHHTMDTCSLSAWLVPFVLAFNLPAVIVLAAHCACPIGFLLGLPFLGQLWEFMPSLDPL